MADRVENVPNAEWKCFCVLNEFYTKYVSSPATAKKYVSIPISWELLRCLIFEILDFWATTVWGSRSMFKCGTTTKYQILRYLIIELLDFGVLDVWGASFIGIWNATLWGTRLLRYKNLTY